MVSVPDYGSCKDIWTVNTVIPISLQSYRCIKRSVSGFNWFIHLLAWFQAWPVWEKLSGCNHCYIQQAQTVIDQPPERIIWCYWQWQTAYTQLLMRIPTIEFVKGIPKSLENDSYLDLNIRNLIVFDAKMTEAGKDNRILNLFTKGSHHRNLSVTYIVQNLFHQGKGNRSISLNSHYLVFFKNPRDKLQILTLAKQMYPSKTAWFIKLYEEEVQRPFGYLFVGLRPTTPDRRRLRTNVSDHHFTNWRTKYVIEFNWQAIISRSLT